MESFIEKNWNLLREFEHISTTVGARADYVQGGGGNTSVKLQDGLMAIKASGYRLSDIRMNKAYAVLQGDKIRDFYLDHQLNDFEDVEKQGAAFTKEQIKTIDGLEHLRPSVEAGFHSLLDTFVIHSHSVYANLATCVTEGREIAKKALLDAPYTCGFVEYADPGSKLTFSIRDELTRVAKETGIRPSVIFMQNHGLIVHHADAKICLDIHEDVNARIAAVYGLSTVSFPDVRLESLPDGSLISGTPFVREMLAGGKYNTKFLLESPLYPDQLVFLTGTLSSGEAGDDTCSLDENTGILTYRMPEAKALVIEQTIAAVLFIAEQAKRSGYSLLTMDDAARNFIANWESEKYRKSIAGK